MNLLTRHPKIAKILRIISLIVIVVFELGFLDVAAVDFSKGMDGPGAVGLFLSILLLGAAMRILGGPKKIGPLVQRVVRSGPPIQGRGLKVRYYVAVGLFALVLLLFVAIGGPIKGPAVDVVVVAYFLGFPLLTWRFLPERIARFLIVHFFRGKLYHRVLSAVLRKKQEPSRLFFTANAGRQIVLLRFGQVVIFTYSLAALALPYLTSLDVAHQVQAEVIFAFLSVPVVAIPGLIYVVMWTYQDSGMRYFDSRGVVVGIPGSRAANLITGFASLGTFLRVAEALGGTLGGAASTIFVLSFFLLSPFLILVTVFHHRFEGRILNRLMPSVGIEQAQIRIEPPA
jgi:hypothetical protein